MIGLILKIKGIEKVDCSLDFYVERDRALHFEKADLLFAYDNGPEYYACIDTDIVGRGALKCRAVIIDGVREVVVSGYTGFTIPCMGEGTTISCRGYSIEFSEAENLPQGGDVPDVDWPDGSNLNDYTTDGVYSIKGKRVNGDNMPILNEGVISARLTVLSTDDGAGNTVVTQVLSLNNNSGGEGNVYVRSAQKGSWKPWGKLQTNIEVGQVNTLDNLTDNGMYSGVLMADTGFDTFVLVVINNYAAAVPAGYGWYVSQLKYSLGLDGSVTVKTRRMDYTYAWSEWEELKGGAGTSNIEAQAPLAQKDGKLSLNIGDGLKVEDEKLVLDDFVREGAVAEYDEENKRLEFKGLGDTSTAVNSAKSLALREFFVAAGAEYNDTGVDIIRTTPWAEYVDNQDILNVSASDVKTIVQGGTTYKYVIDNGVYKVVLTDLLGNIRHNEQYCVHRAGCYYLNGLGDITEQQMMTIYNSKTAFDIVLAGPEVSTRLLQDIVTAPRTLLPPTGSLRRFDNKKIGGYYMVCAGVEVVDFAGGNWATIYIPDINAGDPVFYNCDKLVAISPFKISKAMNLFFNCPNLRYVAIKSNNSLNFKSSPYISKKSILYAINNSTATTAVTITLHPNAYARLVDDVDIIAALRAKPLVTLVSA